MRQVNCGIAKNGNLVRVDMFLKEGRYSMVPIYVDLERLIDKLIID
ncbi:hypothetical protein BN997_00708 [Oceanobacillus oncorhynchi]|uniref:Uncharacterized protein n=1 Tax=Oceanobacillus oncorhynchi TaxID=545501 RepID=A0A0A1MPA2_9BACI|nr:hypothetical protein BN997_00708 [Oceanobacillus oncorhynchi]